MKKAKIIVKRATVLTTYSIRCGTRFGCAYLSTAVSAEVSVGEDHGGHQGPQVDGQTQPAGADLHPHGWHGGPHVLVV